MSEPQAYEVYADKDEIPRNRTHTRFWRQVTEAVDAHYPAWVRVPGEFDSSLPTRIRHGRMKSVPAELYEVEGRFQTGDDGKKRATVFLRRRTAPE